MHEISVRSNYVILIAFYYAKANSDMDESVIAVDANALELHFVRLLSLLPVNGSFKDHFIKALRIFNNIFS